MGMIARNTAADVNVIALIGERGREVRDFIEKDLGEEGLARSVVVVATSDQVPVVRLRGAQVATGIAEYFRSQGLDVLLMMDSVTRVAWVSARSAWRRASPLPLGVTRRRCSRCFRNCWSGRGCRKTARSPGFTPFWSRETI